jgi:hypothetical protein
MRLLTPVLVVVSVLAAGKAGAENPRLTLKLQDVAAQQAVEALSNSGGLPVRLELPPPRGAAAEKLAQRLAQRKSFDWNGVRYADALRQLCDAYQLKPQRLGGSFRLVNGWTRPVPEAGPGIETQTLRLHLRSASVSYGQSIRFGGRAQAGGSNRLSLEAFCRLKDGDADAIVGFDNLAGVDDQGNVVVGETNLPHPPFGHQFPDEWTGHMQLSSPHPRARKLLWLEGELIAYRVCRPVLLELPLAENGTGRGALEGVSVDVVRIETARAREGVGMTTLLARVAVPDAARVVNPLERWNAVKGVALVGKSGRRYDSQSAGSTGSGGNGVTLYEMRFTFPEIAEPVEKAVFRFTEKAEPARIASFRFRDIPLPPEVAFTPRWQVPAPMGALLKQAEKPQPPPPVLEGPFRQAGGGVLVSTIRIAGAPAPVGTLSVGLAQREGGGWGPTRWLDVQVMSGGTARLEDLKPGEYRVLRIYRPREPFAGAAGQWRGSETVVRITANAALQPLSLEWINLPDTERPQLPQRPKPSRPLRKR